MRAVSMEMIVSRLTCDTCAHVVIARSDRRALRPTRSYRLYVSAATLSTTQDRSSFESQAAPANLRTRTVSPGFPKTNISLWLPESIFRIFIQIATPGIPLLGHLSIHSTEEPTFRCRAELSRAEIARKVDTKA
jgi:hypothetical protein